DDYDGRDGLGDMLFVDYILTGPAPAQVEQQVPAITAEQIVEQIAQQWDECEYEASGGNIDIGAAIRAAGARLAAEVQEGGAA
ncbi:hypothetical protein ACUXVY_20570, partial [Chromobacterium haemolyticum]|uniref:hypothetical protein n=1 Tax=Chromobacterium haemolyticum TaxID=394935 RepID=UPI00405636CC